MQNLDSNQTQFSEINPVFESADSTSAQKPVAEESATKKKTSLPLLIGIFGLVLLFVFLMILILIKSQMSSSPSDKGDSVGLVDQANGENDPLLEEIYDLDDQLQNSDPTIDEIPLPPVDMTLRLDPAKKK